LVGSKFHRPFPHAEKIQNDEKKEDKYTSCEQEIQIEQSHDFLLF